MTRPNVFIISDTHFSHDNIIGYSNRPFNSVEEMNEALVHNWNSVVKPTDWVICLGDFALGVKENIALFGKQLNGVKTLVKGNHDRQAKLYEEAGFSDVLPVFTLPSTLGFCDKTIVLSHKPQQILREGEVNIHGHIHDNQLDNSFDKELYFNASVENINYTPIKLQEIITTMGW